MTNAICTQKRQAVQPPSRRRACPATMPRIAPAVPFVEAADGFDPDEMIGLAVATPAAFITGISPDAAARHRFHLIDSGKVCVDCGCGFDSPHDAILDAVTDVEAIATAGVYFVRHVCCPTAAVEGGAQ